MSPTLSLSRNGRPILATTPLGGDTLIPVILEGEEWVSRPYLFTVDFVSTNASVKASSLLGKPIAIQVPISDGKERMIHGLVRRFVSLGRTEEISRYRAELVPALWFLSLSSDCRTFEKMTVLDIVHAVCKGAGVTEVRSKVTTTPPVLPYVVQYRETNLEFVSRLLEEAGLYYTFDHTKDKHTLVLSDAHAGSIPVGAMASVKVYAQGASDKPEADMVFELEREYAVHASSVALSDHALLRSDGTGSASSTSPGARGERFDFRGDLEPNAPAAAAKRLIEIEEGERDMLRGKSSCAGLQSGARVKFVGGQLGADGVEFHVLHVTHRIEGGDVIGGSGLEASYESTFDAIPVDTRYRPPRVTTRPSVRGTQTAKVVGSGGTGEIDVDPDARILLQFPWDRGAGKDGKSTHRVHVASGWSGTGWGLVQLPRIGQEVLVEYLEGDPDRPIVTARVFNSAHKPPYALPANKTQSGWKSRTLGGGSDNFNEIRFEDKKDAEELFTQAEKDLKVHVKHDEKRDVLHDRITVIKHDDTRTVSEGNDAHVVTKGNQTVDVKEGNQTITIAKGDQTVAVSTGKQTVTVKGNHALTVEQGNRLVTIKTGNDTVAVEMGNLAMKVKTGNVSIQAAAGKTSIEALQGILLKVGANSIEIGPAGIKVKGIQVSVEGQAKTEVKGAMVSVQGQAMTQIKGAMTQVNGDGMVMVKGALTMIN